MHAYKLQFALAAAVNPTADGYHCVFGGQGLASSSAVGILADLWCFDSATNGWAEYTGNTEVNVPSNFTTGVIGSHLLGSLAIDRAGRLRLNAFGTIDDLALGASIARLVDESAPAEQAEACDPTEGCRVPTAET